LKFDIEHAQRQLRSLGDPSIVSESTILSEEYRRMEAHEQQAYEIIMDELGELENRSFLKLRELNEAMNDNPAENSGAEGVLNDDIDEGIEDEGSHEDPNEDIIDESDNDDEGSLSDKATNTEEPVEDAENQDTIQEEEEDDQDEDEAEDKTEEEIPEDKTEEEIPEDNEEESNE